MIVGMDSAGKVYLSLVQANSNTAMMELYFSTLIKLLDRKQPGWRKRTIILQDNAPYKTSKDMMEFYSKHLIPVMFTGPHSYVSAFLFYHTDLFPDIATVFNSNYVYIVRLSHRDLVCPLQEKKHQSIRPCHR